MIYGSTTYLFEKNSLGDVIGMWTSGGTKVASYVYDAWGNIISESVSSAHKTASDLNPFRYRSYYYDQETGFYYLQSRYYDPATGRFLNADGYINANGDLQGFNMYAYCSNNPVMNVDPTGEWGWQTLGYFALGVAVTAVVAVFCACGGGIGLMALGVAEATVGTLVKGAIIAGIFTGITMTTKQLIENEGDYLTEENLRETIRSVAVDTVTEMIMAGIKSTKVFRAIKSVINRNILLPAFESCLNFCVATSVSATQAALSRKVSYDQEDLQSDGEKFAVKLYLTFMWNLFKAYMKSE